MREADIRRIDMLLAALYEATEYPLAWRPSGGIGLTDEDRNLLEQHSAITTMTAEELQQRYGGIPEDLPEISRCKSDLQATRNLARGEAECLRRQLSAPRRWLNSSTSLSVRTAALRRTEEQIVTVGAAIDELSERYARLSAYVPTSSQVYARLTPGIRSYVDVVYKPVRMAVPANTLEGIIVIFEHAGDEWDEEQLYDPSQHGESYDLTLRVPYEALTAFDTDANVHDGRLRENIVARWKTCIGHVECDGLTSVGRFISVGHMDFLDSRYWVEMQPTNSQVRRDRKELVGPTKVTDIVADFSSQGYFRESRTTDLWRRTVEGRFEFDLILSSVHSQGQHLTGR